MADLCTGSRFGLLLMLFAFLGLVQTVKECNKIDSCRCSTDEGEIDLRKLAGTGGKPRFSEIPSSNPAFKFSWNPCESYSEAGCTDVAACFIQSTGAGSKTTYYHGIAKQSTAQCVLIGSDCALNYTGEGLVPGKSSLLSITLKCDTSEEGRVDKMSLNIITDKYETVLHSKYACPAVYSGLSVGSILVIVLACVVILYIVCGFVVNKFSRNIEGKEAFPNYSFWTDFPYLIKDGCVFTYHSCRKLCGDGGRSGYASI